MILPHHKTFYNSNTVLSIKTISCVSVVPNIAKQPQSSTNNVGSTVQFRCVNTGVPTPTVTWYKNGKPISADSRHQFSSNGEILTISNLQTTDSGTIECQASNAVGVTTSREAVLTVA